MTRHIPQDFVSQTSLADDLEIRLTQGKNKEMPALIDKDPESLRSFEGLRSSEIAVGVEGFLSAGDLGSTMK